MENVQAKEKTSPYPIIPALSSYHSHAKLQNMSISIFYDTPASSKNLVSHCFQGWLNLVAYCRLSKQTHQVIDYHYEIHHCFGSAKALHIKSISTKIILQFLNPVLSICSYDA